MILIFRVNFRHNFPNILGSIFLIYSASNVNKHSIPRLVEASISISHNCKVFTDHLSTCFLTGLLCWFLCSLNRVIKCRVFWQHSRLNILDLLIYILHDFGAVSWWQVLKLEDTFSVSAVSIMVELRHLNILIV